MLRPYYGGVNDRAYGNLNICYNSMQFSFKRPQTSKSVSTFYKDKLKDKSHLKNSLQLPQVDNPPEASRRWEAAAERINKDMVIQRILHANGEPFRMLSKLGGKQYSSQPKLEQPDLSSRPRNSSKERTRSRVIPVLRIPEPEQAAKIVGQTLQPGTNGLRRRRRGEQAKGRGLQRELKAGTIFYESPVIKIGYNMQYEAHLRIEHISQIRPDHGGTICRNSIIFFLKDAPFSPNIISEKNEQLPIALSLFPEFYDSKLSLSHARRQQYLLNMLTQMNGTYDPERMARMSKFSNYLPFEPTRFIQTAKLLMVSNEANYKEEWLNGIVKKVKGLTPDDIRKLLREQWDFFNMGNAISTLDYLLKDPKTVANMNLSPYLATRVISSKNVLYHGGYCKSIYTSWNGFVQNGRKKLAIRLRKYHSCTQAIHGWYTLFESLQLYERDFLRFIDESVSVELFRKVQLVKIRFGVAILKHIWFRGILTLYHHNRMLLKQREEYQPLLGYVSSLAPYVKQAKERAKDLKNTEEIVNFYLNFYQNFISSLHKPGKLQQIEQLMIGSEVTSNTTPQIANVEVLLNLQFGRTIQKSFLSLQQQIMDCPQQPMLRLTLIIDRQTIKFLEQEEDIVNSFLEVIQGILGVSIEGFELNLKFDPAEQPQQRMRRTDMSLNLQKQLKNTKPSSEVESEPLARHYPEISERSERSSLSEQKHFCLKYKTAFIFEESIKAMILRVREYYQECFVILGQFQVYLPFIKLTTTQKIFQELQGSSVEESFLKNLSIIAKYRESLERLGRLVRINLFEVNCELPIRILQQRIRQIQYIIEQNYLNIIHEKMEALDSELNSLKIAIHDAALNPTEPEQLEQRLVGFRSALFQAHSRTQRIAQMVLFCLQNKRKADTVTTCYCQLVAKKQQLHRQVDRLANQLELTRPHLQAELEQQARKLSADIDRSMEKMHDLETTCFEFSNLPEYIQGLKELQIQFSQLHASIDRIEEANRKSMGGRSSLGDKVQICNREEERLSLAVQYWESFYRFETYFKEIGKQEAGKVQFSEFTNQLQSSEKVVGSLKAVEKQWWKASERSNWKQIIHPTHDYYSRKFATDLQICKQAQPQLKILTNRKIRDRHWRLYALEEFSNVNFRQLGRTELISRQQQLEHMNEQVNFQHEILLGYEAIQKQMRAHKLLVVDLNNSDVLDLENVANCLQFLHNVVIQIEAVIRRDVRGYLKEQLSELLKIAGETEKRLGQWEAVEREYIRFIRYHLANEDYQHGLFDDLGQFHRKLIKSYDIDNSILFISKNIVMDSYLTQIKDSLCELSLRLSVSLTTVRTDYPRLHLLNDQQLLDFMSSGADVPRYLKKCLPHISAFGLRQGAIERVGNGRGLNFAEPLYIQQMLGRVQVWVAQLEDLIRMRMKQHYKTSLILSEGSGTADLQDNFYQKYPLQLAILQDYLKFTEQAEAALTDHNLPVLLKQIEAKMEEQIKERREVWRLLLQIVFRDMINMLIRIDGVGIHSFEWARLPQFHRKAGLLEPRVTILQQEYVYGFNYLEDCDLIYTDNVLTGNCIVGQSHIGKTALIKHTAYLCGQELLVFDPSTLDIRPVLTGALLDHFKVAIHAGSWLYLRRADRLDEEQLKLAAECMAAMQDAVKSGSSRLTLSGQSLPLNRNTRVFLSLSTLQMPLPGRLCGQIRPIWVAAPSPRILLQHYLQSKCAASVEVGRVLRFCSWLDRHGQLPLQLVSWIRSQDNPDLFTGNQLYRKLIESHIFPSADCESLLQNLNKEDGKLIESKSLLLNEQLKKNRELLIFGEAGIGKTHSIISCLGQQQWILLDAHNYLTIDDFYEVIKAIQESQPKVSYVLLKHALPHYSLIKQHLAGYRIVLIEHSLAHLHQALLQQLQLINYSQFLPKDRPLVSKLIASTFSNQQASNSEVFFILTSETLFLRIIKGIEEAVAEGTSIAQLHIHFLTLLKEMISEQYELSVAFLFCIFWTYGQQIEEKKLQNILESYLPPEDFNPSKFKKISNNRRSEQTLIATIRQILANGRLLPLTELMPLKKGKFIRNVDGNELLTVRYIELFEGKPVSLHSNLMHNLTLLRKLFPATILIDSRDWLTTLLNVTVSQPRKFFNFSHMSPSTIFSQLFQSIQRQGFTYNFAGTHILIDDLYLCPDRSQAQLQSLLDYGFALAPEPMPARLSLWKLKGAILTVGSKWGQSNESKALHIRISQASLGSLFNEYVQCFCQRWLQVDRSVFCLLNLSHNIVRLYKDQDNRYFWFKNPLLLLQQATPQTLTSFVQEYISYLMDMLPDQIDTLANHRAMLELSIDEEVQKTEQVINTNQKYSRFYEQSVLVQKLVADHEVLAEIQGKQVESIFFQRFIRNYFTRDILDYVRKLAQRISHHHLLLLPDRYPHAQRIAAYACKLASRSLHIYHPNQSIPNDNSAIWIDLDQFGEQAVQEIQDAVKLKRKIGSNELRFVIKASLQSQQTKTLLRAYPFLKSYFLAVVLHKTDNERIEHTGSSKNIIEDNYEGSRYVERLEQLISRQGLDCNFRDEFMRVYQLNRRRQLSKFQFYRKITSQMIVNLDLLSLAYRNAPLKQVTLRSQAQTLKNTRKKETQQVNHLRARLNKCSTKAEVLVDLLKTRQEEQNGCLNRLIQTTTPLFIKLEKAERRIEAIETVQFTRLKNNLKNNQNNAAVQPIHQLLAYLLDKAEPKERAQPLSCLSSPQALVSAFRQLRIKENYSSDRQKGTGTAQSEECIGGKRITSGMNGGRLKTFLNRVEQVEGQAKKFQKVSLVYKSIMGWLGMFQQVCQHLKEYHERNDESDSRLTTALVRLNQQLGEQSDPEQQKKNLEALAIGSQQQIQQIQEQLNQLEKSCKSAESQEQRLTRLQKFYAGRESRLGRISSLLTQSEYMKKISSSVSLYFKNMEGLVFEQSLIRLSLNQWLEDEDPPDPQLAFGVFTFRSDVHSLREKYGYGSLGSHSEELQILNDLFQDDVRSLSLIEDRNGLLKGKLAQIAEDRRFLVKELRHTDSSTLLGLVGSKLGDAQKILLLHENVHYLEAHHNDKASTAELIRLLQLASRNRRIIYVANYLPPLPSDLYSLCNFGKVVVSRQRFLCDLTQVFGVLAIRDQGETDSSKRRTDVAIVVSERNSKMKELMANIQLLADSLQGQPMLDQEDAESERCEYLENNLGNLSKLEEQLQSAQKNTTSWNYLGPASRELVSKELQRYYILYQFADHCNCTSSSQFFSSPSFYPDWLSLLKDLREENISLFTRVDHRPVISQIVVSPDGIPEQRPADDFHASRVEEEHIHADQVLNRSFRQHNLQIFNLLVEKLCKNAHWVERTALLQFVMGAAVLLALPSHQPILHKAVFQFLKEPAAVSHQQAIGRCSDVTSLLDYKDSQSLESQLSRLIQELSDSQSKAPADSGLGIFLYLYQLIMLQPANQLPVQFLTRLGNTGRSKWAFARSAMAVRAQGQVALKVGAAGNLSLTLQGRVSEKQKAVTIIEEEKYLLDDLIEVLRIKALSRKRELVSLLVDRSCTSQLLQQIGQYHASGRHWVLLANISVSNSHLREGAGVLLAEILKQLGRLGSNPYFRLFVVLEKESEADSPYYNKYQISKLKSYHQLSAEQYCRAVNQLALDSHPRHPGKSLMEHLIVATLGDPESHAALIRSRLEEAFVFYSLLLKQYRIFREEDFRIYYRMLVAELTKLGYLRGEQSQRNFYTFLGQYFGQLPMLQAQAVKQSIQVESQLSKEGITAGTMLRQDQISPSETAVVLEYISLRKLNQYIRTINPEFAALIKSEVILSNHLLSRQSAVNATAQCTWVPKTITKRAQRIFDEDCGRFRQRLPLLRILSGVRLKQVCSTKQVEIANSQEFYVFVGGFMLKQLKELLGQGQQARLSAGLGGFSSARDYLTRMRIVLIDDQSYQQIPLKEEEVSSAISNRNDCESKFIIAVRKAPILKISELNAEHEQINRLLKRYTIHLLLDGQTAITFNYR